MDEIFPKCLVALNIQVRHPDRILNGDKEYNDVIEYILIYSNTSSAKMPKRIEEKTDDEYIYSIKEIGNPEIIYLDKKRVEIYTPEKYALITQKPNKLLTKKISIRGALREKNSSGRFYVKNIEPIKNQYPPETIFKVERVGDDHFGFRYFYTPSKKNKNGGYLQGKPISSNITEKQYPNFLNYELDYNRVSPEGDVLFRNGKKPESLLSFLISMFTQEKDIVLDYHLGSGTTAAVAQKINRQYIGIEQMDYIEHLTIKRLSNVLNGEKSGISKSVNWQGGGSFVYCELAKANQIFIETIQAAKSTEELITIWNEMQDKAFLSYQFNKKSFEELRANFWELTISEQKKFLIEILDKNMLYVPLSEIDDQTYKITESDKILNKHFFD